MEEASGAEDQLSCPDCLDVQKGPAAVPSSQSYSMSCINSYLDQEDHVGVYSCPQCRQTFTPNPVLDRNSILADVEEKLKITGLQETTPADHHAGPGDVECDVCTGKKHKAIKFCLVCLFSYCPSHLQLHDELNPEMKHKLVDATGHLQDKVCSHHDKLLDVYCRTDQQCICFLCMMDEHRGHDTVSAVIARTEKQEQMTETQKEIQDTIQERQKKLQELREAVDSLTHSAQTAVEDSERIFTEMIHSIERRRSEVTELIRDQEKAAVSQAEGLIERLEQEIEDLKRRDSELEQLSHTEDYIYLLQRYLSLCDPPKSGDSPISHISPHCDFGGLKNAVSDLRDKIIQFLHEESVVKSVSEVHIIEPKTREELLQYSCHLTLDPNTAHKQLHLSKRNRMVTWKSEPQSYQKTKGRFDWYYQLLCKEDLTGCCYWEVEWRADAFAVAVTYKGISRNGEGLDCCLGFNDKSWRLSCTPNRYYFWHNNVKTEVFGPRSSKIGVYLNHRAGTLSFYSVSDTVTLLYRVQTTFTEPLHAGFSVSGSLATIKLI